MIRRAVLWAAVAVALAGCHRDCARRGVFHAPPRLGSHVLVLAPHPDDEVLGAGGVMAEAVRRTAEVDVVVATDGEAGPNRTAAPDLAEARRAETRQALGRLGVTPEHVHFLGYADGHLGAAWSERWRAELRGDGDEPGTRVLDALRAALRTHPPDTVVMPVPLDAHPDHRALGRFALLAVLAEFPQDPAPDLLGYLIHGGRSWPGCGGDVHVDVSPPEGCAALLPWASFPLDAGTAALKATLIREYRSQLGSRGALLRYANANEPFVHGWIVRANRSMAPWRPGVHRDADAVLIEVPRVPCVLVPGDRLRLRYVRRGEIAERLVELDPEARVLGGKPGESLVPAEDVRVTLRHGALRLALAASAFGDTRGAVLEVLPGTHHPDAPGWLLRW